MTSWFFGYRRIENFVNLLLTFVCDRLRGDPRGGCNVVEYTSESTSYAGTLKGRLGNVTAHNLLATGELVGLLDRETGKYCMYTVIRR